MKIKSLSVFLAAALIFLPVAFAQAITVCKDGTCDFTSIKAALNDRDHFGETITVKPGIYQESNLKVTGRILQSETPNNPKATIIDATGSGKPVIYSASNCTIMGFTIRGGTADAGAEPGGGIRTSAAVVLLDLTIENNYSTSIGGGVGSNSGGSVTIINCTIRNNRAIGGGGVGLSGPELIVIVDSRIEGNESFGNSNGSAWGGGVYAGSYGYMEIENSTITGNRLTGSGSNYGAGIRTKRTTQLNNVTITDNIANEAQNPGFGGGIHTSNANLYIAGGSISGNEADRGGGISLSTKRLFSSAVISGNIARDGVAGSGGGIYCSYPDFLEISSGTVSGNTPDDIGCIPSGQLPSSAKPDSAANPDSSGTDGDPINTFTGELFDQFSPDINMSGHMPLFFARYYASGLLKANISGRLGDNWRHNFEWTLTHIGSNINIVNNRGRLIQFVQNGSAWDLTGRTSIVYQLVEGGGDFTLLDPGSNRFYKFNAVGQLTSVEDGKGNVHSLSYDAGGLLTQVTDGHGRTLSFSYNPDNHLVSITDGTRTVGFAYTADNLTTVTDLMGNDTVYTYAAGGLMTASTSPAGNTPYTQTYNGSSKVTSQTDANGNTFSFNYTGSDTTLTDPLGNTRVHTHTATGEFSNRQDQAGLSFTMGSDATGRRNSITDRLGDTTTYDYHPPSGNMSSLTNAEGNATVISYTPRLFGGLTLYDITTLEHADGTAESMGYDAKGNVTSHTDQIGNTSTATYNDNGQTLTSTNAAGGIITNTYNPDGTHATRSDPEGNITTFEYDGLKRLNLITFVDGNTYSFNHNELNQLLSTTDPNGHITTMTYDTNGNLAGTTDPMGHTTIYIYDGNERPLTVTDPLGNTTNSSYNSLGKIATVTDENANTTTFGYDILGRFTSTTDPAGNEWTQTYDEEAILTSATDPLGNTMTFDSDSMGRITRTTSPMGNLSSVTYDAMGRLATTTDPVGNTTTLTRDARGLLSGITLDAGPVTAGYTRNALGQITAVTDPGGNNWLRSYDDQGRLTSSSDPLGNTITIAYDSRNRISLINYPGSLGALTRGYDSVGNLISAAYSGGPTLNYAYDANNRLTAANGITRSYDANGRINDTNGIAIDRDPGGRIISMTLAPGKTVTYEYFANDSLKQVTDWTGGVTTFSYDDAGRLTEITRPNGVNTTNTWDADSRLTGITEGAVSAIALTRDAIGQITAAARNVPLPASAAAMTGNANTYDAASQVSGFTYDALGRLTSDTARTYSWDLASMLTSVTEGATTTSFTYDGAGQRLSRTIAGNTRRYVWNYALGLPCVSIETQAGVNLRYYIHTPGGTLLYSIEAADNSRQDYHFDEMGNTIFVTDNAGTVIAAYTYTPYGQPIASTGSLDNPFTWQGRYGVMDDSNGLYYMRARYYDSITGRFISRDTVKSISPKSVNPYQYALANPMRFIDPSGARSQQEIDLALAKQKLHRAKAAQDAALASSSRAMRAFYTVRMSSGFVSFFTDFNNTERDDTTRADNRALVDQIAADNNYRRAKRELKIAEANYEAYKAVNGAARAANNVLDRPAQVGRDHIESFAEFFLVDIPQSEKEANKLHAPWRDLPDYQNEADKALKDLLDWIFPGWEEDESVVPELAPIVTIA